MARRIVLKPHLSSAELEQRYRGAHDPVERSHLQMLWLLSQGHSGVQVAHMVGYSAVWVREVAKRYNQSGVEAVGDGRRHNPGGQFFLSGEQQEELRQAIVQGVTPEGGVWNSRAVAKWIAHATGRAVKAVHVQRGWEYLRRLGLSPQVPRPRHLKADEAAQEEFKKNTRSSRASPERAASPRGGGGVGLR